MQLQFYWSVGGALVAMLVERCTCDWKAADSNLGLKGPDGTISKFSASCAVPVFWKRHKTETSSQSPNSAGSLKLTLSFDLLRFEGIDTCH